MPDIIQLLPDHVANQIAAGEVVQRPASVVKELLENAIDAKASNIKLVIKNAGKTLIQVIDDGIGMSTTDARLSFERHATSKIKTAQDLFNLHTKGFRGEALASIAAIAHVELKTKPENTEIGTHLIIEGSKVISQEATVTQKGTIITVKNLFYNIPARRNFLKSDTVEMRHIVDEFHRVALAHPQISFSFISNGSAVFSLPESNLRQRIVAIFGSKTNEKLVPIQEKTEVVSMSGFVLKPAFAKKSRGEQFFFVNNRFIKNGYLHHAVLSAFEGLIKPATHPGYFIFLEVDPKSIDINIHPTKTEIKFDDEHTIYALLRATIKHSLGQFNIGPVLDFDKDSSLETPYDYSKKTPVAPTIEVDRNFNPFVENKQRTSLSGSFSKKEKQPHWEAMYVGLKTAESKGLSNIEFESEEVTGSFFENTKNTESDGSLFQLQNKYIVSPLKNGLLIVNQNLAHQRILYETFLKHMTASDAVCQQLLFPLVLDFSKPDVLKLKEVKAQLEKAGFRFSVMEEETIEITGIPSGFESEKIPAVLIQLISDIENDIPQTQFNIQEVLAKSLAKSLAIKSGVSLNKQEQEHMIHQLFACKEPTVCPNNKKVVITLDIQEIANKF
jgi:DNA mismatch repair protein MutL